MSLASTVGLGTNFQGQQLLEGNSFCNTPRDMTSAIVKYSCSLSGAIGHFLKDIHYYNYTEPKLASDSKNHAWIYSYSMTKQRSSSGPCSSVTVNQSINLFIGLTCKLSPVRTTLMHRKDRLAADKCSRKKFNLKQLFEAPW